VDSGIEEFNKKEKNLGKDFIGPQCIFKSLDLGIALGALMLSMRFYHFDRKN
jgi:uncharacterized ferredoxin-like protein